MKSLTIDTAHWQKYHKRKPRRGEMGIWAFSLHPREIHFVAPYEEACKLAIKTAQERNHQGKITLIL